jgi:hypothetical protein
MSMFSAPSSPSDGITWENHNGALILIDVLGQEHGVKTSFGEKDPVRANIAVIDGPGAGETFDDSLIFPTLLISQTRNQIGNKVLGRLGTGNAKPGQKPPWLLQEATPEDIAKAEKWVTEHAKPAVQSAQAPF